MLHTRMVRRKINWRTLPWKRYILTALKQLLCILICLLVVVPFYVVVINAFKTKGEAARMNVFLPTVWHVENFTEVIRKGKLMQGFLNSLLYAGASSLVGVLLSSMAAFVICRKHTRTNGTLFYFILCGLFFPINYVTLIQVLNFLGVNNTKLGLVLVYTSSMIPFCVFVMRNFVLTVPVELDEAAVLDGVGPLGLFFRIAAPVLKPALFTCFLLQFMGVWSDFLTPLYVISASSLWPMNLAVYNFFGKYAAYWNLVFADILLTVMPVVILYLFGQRYIISGMTSGAVKE
jgi:raffinose/stachyose/melibiose transport system permease protein